MSPAEIAALIGAAAAFLTALSAWTNARNSKDVADKLRREVDELKAERKSLLAHNDYQDEILIDRERQIIRLQRKLEQWAAWGQTVGRMMNEMQLQIGYLNQQQGGAALKTTTPLPPLRAMDEDDE